MKSTRDVVTMPFAFLYNVNFFHLNSSLYNSTLLIHDVTLGSGLRCTQHVIC